MSSSPFLPLRRIILQISRHHQVHTPQVMPLSHKCMLQWRTFASIVSREHALRLRPMVSFRHALNLSSSSKVLKDETVNGVQQSKGSSPIEEENDIDTSTLLESWFYEVCGRGSLTATLPFHTYIKPLNPQVYPQMNKVILRLHFDTGKSREVPSPHELSEITDLYRLNVDFDKDKANMNLSCDVVKGLFLPVVCTMHIPLQFDLKLQMTGDASISVEKLESNTIHIETEKGNSSFKGLKCGSVTAMCQSGSIISQSTLLGNVFFHTGGSGCIEAGKLQGTNISCETSMGSMSVKSLYSETATFRSEAGDIQLGNCHGQLCVQSQSSRLKIESLEGDIDASLHSGDINVHLSKPNKSDIELKTGNITLSFPEGVFTNLNLDCPEVVVDESINASLDSDSQPHHLEGYIGQDESGAQVNARTLSGTIYLKQMDWIQTTMFAAFMRGDDTDHSK